MAIDDNNGLAILRVKKVFKAVMQGIAVGRNKDDLRSGNSFDRVQIWRPMIYLFKKCILNDSL